MDEHWSPKQYRHYLATGQAPGSSGAEPKEEKQPKKQSKMRNKITIIDGIRFDSQLEAAYYLDLMDRVNCKVVSHFLMQVPMHCGGGVKYKLDFLVFYTDGHQEYVDVKGQRTQAYKNKKKQIEERYPISIIEIERKDVPESFISTAREIDQLNRSNAK